MEIVAVDRSLLDAGAADGDESDAVALSCVEWLLAETNACFQQRQLAQKAVQLSSSRLRDSILSVVFAASSRADLPLSVARFNAEPMPHAEVKDRHAVRSVPLRTTDALLNAQPELQSPTASYSSRGSPLSYGHYQGSPLSELHFRDYEEVPAEPIPMPQLSPIAASSLAIPRTVSRQPWLVMPHALSELILTCSPLLLSAPYDLIIDAFASSSDVSGQWQGWRIVERRPR
ncbi:hypothetical protein BBJ28_00013324 [Nothophytophthora sp. Chile5]|nr:hypothetical protein BBJ28_00013324 [Nothophytophthora sp. Chile5]